jgi:hypothetical protein
MGLPSTRVAEPCQASQNEAPCPAKAGLKLDSQALGTIQNVYSILLWFPL